MPQKLTNVNQQNVQQTTPKHDMHLPLFVSYEKWLQCTWHTKSREHVTLCSRYDLAIFGQVSNCLKQNGGS